MKPLNRPMFRTGGPIKEGIMSGIQEPRQGYQRGKIVSSILSRIPGGQKIISGTKDIIPRTINRIKNFYKTPPSTSKDLVVYNAAEAAKRNPAFLTNRYLFEKGVKPVAGGIYKTAKSVFPYTGVGTIAAGGGLGIYNMLKDPKVDGDGVSEINKLKAAIGMPENLTIRKDMSTANEIADKLNEDAIKTAEELRKEKIQRYRDIVDIKGMNKAAAYDSLIAASKAIGESGDFKGDLKSGKLINQIIQSTSKAFDKPKATKDAIDTLILKGEIESDIAAGKPSTYLKAAQDMVATGAAKNITEAMKTLTKSENSMSTTLAAVLSKGQRLDDKLVGVAYREETGKIPAGSVKLSEVNEWKENNAGKTEVDYVKEILTKTELAPGDYVIGERVVTVDEDKNVSFFY